jgi:DNA-directed RNA polymerase specialized sigma subunit
MYMATAKKNYIDNKEFEKTILDYIQDNKTHEEALVKMLELLINNILMTFKFKVDYDDARQECFVLCLKVLKNFTKDKGSAFNYFTTVIVNNLKLMYSKAKKYNNKIARYRELNGDVFSTPESVSPS